MQKKAPRRRLAVASFPVVLWFATIGIAAPESRLEIRGEIVLSPTEEGGADQAIVVLTGATDPFSAQTRSDRRSRFRFPKLEPGTYNPSILIPGRQIRRQTVEVTPSLADARGVVTVTVTLDLTDEESKGGAPPGRSVSVRELSIPRAARREFTRAEKELGKRNTEEALRRQTILDRRLDQRGPMRGQIAVALIIGHDQHDIRPCDSPPRVTAPHYRRKPLRPAQGTTDTRDSAHHLLPGGKRPDRGEPNARPNYNLHSLREVK